MASSWRQLVVGCAVAAMLGACRSDADTVASGDYDPAHPPALLPITGSVSVVDPALFRWEGKYWVFSTGPGIVVHSSTDLSTFRREAAVFQSNPAWIAEKLPDVTDLWSPELRFFGGLLHLYYAASTFTSNGKSCIGHATSSKPEGPFTDHGPLICSNLPGTAPAPFDAIDPAVLLNTPDDPWLVFGSWGDGIHLVQLDLNGNPRDTNVIYQLAVNPATHPQASFLYRWRNYYYLFVSFGSNPAHSLYVGRSTAITGPYVARDGTPMLQGGGTLLLSGDSRFKGPGSNSILDDGDRRINAYHVYDSQQNNTAVLHMAPLLFDNDGWPFTGGP